RLIREEIQKGNETLPDASKVCRFLLLTKDLEADDAEMTRTRKVRRNFVAEKYASVIDAFYSGRTEVPLSTAITYEDGRLAMIAFGFGLERAVLRKLIGRPIIAVVMATIGLAAVLRGIGPLTWGADTKNLALPISDEPFVLGPLFIPPIQILGALVSLG